MRLADSVVLVTGASAGIGAATVRALAEAKANVALNARRARRLSDLAERLAAYPGRRLPLAGDIRDEGTARHLVARTLETFGRIDVLINNAGVGAYFSLVDTPGSAMHQLVETNLLGPMRLTQAALPHMIRQGRGYLVNVSSLAGQRPLPGMAFYGATKGALELLSRGWRLELSTGPVRVMTVYPGRTVTDFAQAASGVYRAPPTGFGRVPAERVARAIVRGLERDRTAVFVTPYDWLFFHLNRLMPGTVDWLIARWVARQQGMADQAGTQL